MVDEPEKKVAEVESTVTSSVGTETVAETGESSGSQVNQSQSIEQQIQDEQNVSAQGAIPQIKLKKSRELIKGDEGKGGLFKSLGDLIVPIAAILVFILIVIFVYIPFTKDFKQTREDTAKLQDRVNKNKEKISTLSSVDNSQLDQDLELVTISIKDKMDVSELAREVEEIAKANGLQSTEISMSNTETIEANIEEDAVILDLKNYKTISGPFSFHGTLGDVTEFLVELRSKSPTIFFLRRVDISEYVPEEGDLEADNQIVDQNTGETGTSFTETIWNVDIYIDAFIGEKITGFKTEDFLDVYDSTDVIKEISERSVILQEGGDESNGNTDSETTPQTSDESDSGTSNGSAQ